MMLESKSGLKLNRFWISSYGKGDIIAGLNKLVVDKLEQMSSG